MQRLVIITGASRGIGATIALETNRKFKKGTLFLLLARDEVKLEEVKNKLTSESAENKIINLKLDFSVNYQKTELMHMIKSSLNSTDLKEIKEAYIFYNHGTLKLGSIESVAENLNEDFQINVFSVWTLTSVLSDILPLEQVPTQFHINISSLLASLVQKNYSVYNTTRSSRATFFRCLAAEHPNLRVLNYQPGPVYTDMQKQIYENNEAHLSSSYRELYEQGKLVYPEETVRRLWEILDKNEFENAATIDYYDSV
ncbi:unnamed protein product [Brachionus calyciflorus]|uniref:Sepiapterin reductase n=1 Tax=Brachionus calyciflorus TaxID=104777 RepID=A0A813S3A6_9BILA|nr:unnamed protein product [Brachionus calyciflorus]